MNLLIRNFIILFFFLIAVSCASKRKVNQTVLEEQVNPFDRYGTYGRN